MLRSSFFIWLGIFLIFNLVVVESLENEGNQGQLHFDGGVNEGEEGATNEDVQGGSIPELLPPQTEDSGQGQVGYPEDSSNGNSGTPETEGQGISSGTPDGGAPPSGGSHENPLPTDENQNNNIQPPEIQKCWLTGCQDRRHRFLCPADTIISETQKCILDDGRIGIEAKCCRNDALGD